MGKSVETTTSTNNGGEMKRKITSRRNAKRKYCAQEPLDFRYENKYLRDGADYTAKAAKTIQKLRAPRDLIWINLDCRRYNLSNKCAPLCPHRWQWVGKIQFLHCRHRSNWSIRHGRGMFDVAQESSGPRWRIRNKQIRTTRVKIWI